MSREQSDRSAVCASNLVVTLLTQLAASFLQFAAMVSLAAKSLLFLHGQKTDLLSVREMLHAKTAKLVKMMKQQMRSLMPI